VSTLSPARKVAFEVLRRVETGAFASDLLRDRTSGLKTRDAALTHELVFGVLRFQAQLDQLAEHFSGRDARGLDREVLLALRLGTYQIRYLDRVPRHAAVDESVEMVKRAHKRSATGLVNAVLRKVDLRPVVWRDRATELSVPAWLLDRWNHHYGAGQAEAIARAFLLPPETFIRVPATRAAEISALPTEPTDIPGCFRLRSGDPGVFRRQDIGSQTIVALLELQPGELFLDLCAAPGNKTAQALETPVRAIACDRSRRRLAELSGLGASLVVCDGTRALPFGARFDKILVDAPCSGTGTISRNPEIKWRVSPEDFERHRNRQVVLLGNALDALAKGGRLVYSTCSLEPEENEQVLDLVLANRAEVDVQQTLRRLPGRDPGDGFWAAVITSE